MRSTDELDMILISNAVGLKFIYMIISNHYNDEGKIDMYNRFISSVFRKWRSSHKNNA
jgi:hypothetical protein